MNIVHSPSVKEFLDKPYLYMSMYRNRSKPDDDPSRRRQYRILRLRASGRTYSTTTMLPASSQNQGEKRLQDDGVASLVAGHHEAAEDVRRPANYVNILCPKTAQHVKNLYPFSSKHLVTQSQKTERFHVLFTFILPLLRIGSHKI